MTTKRHSADLGPGRYRQWRLLSPPVLEEYHSGHCSGPWQPAHQRVGDAAGSELTLVTCRSWATGQARGQRGQSAISPVSCAELGLINVASHQSAGRRRCAAGLPDSTQWRLDARRCRPLSSLLPSGMPGGSLPRQLTAAGASVLIKSPGPR